MLTIARMDLAIYTEAYCCAVSRQGTRYCICKWAMPLYVGSLRPDKVAFKQINIFKSLKHQHYQRDSLRAFDCTYTPHV